jgi:DNA adenine methylase
MRYFGGKQRLSKELAAIINGFKPEIYHEPFCGMFSVGSKVTAPIRSGADSQLDLILLLQAVQEGWVGPSELDERAYKTLRTMEPSELRGFAGFGCSHSGKFFGGYARDSVGHNYAAAARASLLKLAPLIQGVRFYQQDYRSCAVPADVIYCDPPYAKTTGYTVGSFDTDEFWAWVKQRAKHSLVLVSEYSGPEWARVIWQKDVKTAMNSDGGKLQRTEKLFACGDL